MSFTIKCDKCGKERKLEHGNDFRKGYITLYSYGSNSGDEINIDIDCGCGNEIEEKLHYR